jgi:hypothetical protein
MRCVLINYPAAEDQLWDAPSVAQFLDVGRSAVV